MDAGITYCQVFISHFWQALYATCRLLMPLMLHIELVDDLAECLVHHYAGNVGLAGCLQYNTQQTEKYCISTLAQLWQSMQRTAAARLAVTKAIDL